MDFPRESLAASAAELAQQGIYVGTSSWKYEGWLGTIYTDDCYRTRGRFSRAKFEKTCLFEYGRIFKTACLDAGFYQFPSAKMLDGIFSVQKFQPYNEVKELNLEARAALIDLLTTPAKPGRPGRRFLYVNNRLEGCALWTIYAAISGLLARPEARPPLARQAGNS